MSHKRVAIVGAGAAGLMCAARIKELKPEYDVLIFEKNNKLGAKVMISGGGRCNVTTGLRDMRLLFEKYPRGKRFLQTAIGKFPPKDVYEWFESHGVPLKTEKDLRVFPQSNNGKDVVGVFEKIFSQQEVQVKMNEGVEKIERGTSGFIVSTSVSDYQVDALVLTTGGNAYRHTGSTGDGYVFAESMGHSITPLGPSLNSFLTAEEWAKGLSGISLAAAGFRTKDEQGKKVFLQGPMIFTHFGISGPEVFALSAQLAFRDVSVASPVEIHLIPDSSKSPSEWESLIRQHQKDSSSKQSQQLFKGVFPKRFTEVLLNLVGIDPSQKIETLQKKQINRLLDALSQGLPLKLIKRRPGDEFVTAGGVTTSEVDQKSMHSKLCPGLFFAGEILDVDGVTGGFNLQASWATGRLAGEGVCSM